MKTTLTKEEYFKSYRRYNCLDDYFNYNKVLDVHNLFQINSYRYSLTSQFLYKFFDFNTNDFRKLSRLLFIRTLPKLQLYCKYPRLPYMISKFLSSSYIDYNECMNIQDEMNCYFSSTKVDLYTNEYLRRLNFLITEETDLRYAYMIGSLINFFDAIKDNSIYYILETSILAVTKTYSNDTYNN